MSDCGLYRQVIFMGGWSLQQVGSMSHTYLIVAASEQVNMKTTAFSHVFKILY